MSPLTAPIGSRFPGLNPGNQFNYATRFAPGGQVSNLSAQRGRRRRQAPELRRPVAGGLRQPGRVQLRRQEPDPADRPVLAPPDLHPALPPRRRAGRGPREPDAGRALPALSGASLRQVPPGVHRHRPDRRNGPELRLDVQPGRLLDGRQYRPGRRLHPGDRRPRSRSTSTARTSPTSSGSSSSTSSSSRARPRACRSSRSTRQG